MRAPLWLTMTGTGAEVTASLAKCRNCGHTKVTSDPCGFDHAAALMEFGQSHPELVEAIRATKEVGHPTDTESETP